MRLAAVAIVVGVLFNMGCDSRVADDVSAPGGGEIQASYASRFDAAAAIGSSSERDKALARLAVDAARGGDAEIAKRCLQTISSSSLKDDSAFDVVVALTRVGKGTEAKEVADGISSSSRRDEALARIAGGG